jgi:hypothetical protein
MFRVTKDRRPQLNDCVSSIQIEPGSWAPSPFSWYLGQSYLRGKRGAIPESGDVILRNEFMDKLLTK